MKTKRYVKSVILALMVSGLCLQTLAGAQVKPQVQSTSTNTTEAERAALKAKQKTNSTNPSLQAALVRLNKAEAQVKRMEKSGSPSQKMSAKTALDKAEDQYVGMLSKLSGVSEKHIGDMHTAGTTWADVPHELEVRDASEHMAKNDKGSIGSGGHITGSNDQGETHQGRGGNSSVGTGGGDHDNPNGGGNDNGGGSNGGGNDSGSSSNGGGNDSGSGSNGGGNDSGSGSNGGGNDSGSGSNGGGNDSGSGSNGGDNDSGHDSGGGGNDSGSGSNGGGNDSSSGSNGGDNDGGHDSGGGNDGGNRE